MTALRSAFRGVVAMRGVAAVAILTLAIGIAAATTMFSAVYAALIRPLPFSDPDSLVLLFTTRTRPGEARETLRWSRALIDALHASVTSYESIASFTTSLVAVSGGAGEPEQVNGEVVSPNYFATLRVTPAMGRTFIDSEDAAPGSAPVVILSDRLWRARYGADPSIVGRTMRVNGVSLSVVGIMPRGFSGLSETSQLWIPRVMAPGLTYEGYLSTPQRFITVVARLKAGVALERASAELDAVGGAFADREAPVGTRWGALARLAGDVRVDASLRRSVLLLLASAACVLLITCVNVAGLLLARGRVRRRELAIRMAIGSGRARLTRQLLLESLILAAMAAAAGTLLAFWGVDLFARYAPAVLVTGRVPISPFSTPSLDLRALAFVLAITLTTSILCGLAPALEASRVQLTDALKDDDRGAAGGRRRAFRALVVSEVALATLLLMSAAMLLDSFAGIQRLRQGFNPDGVLTFWVRPPVSRYPVGEGPRIVERLLTSVRAVPGVHYAAVNRCTPFTGCSRTQLFIPGRPNDPRFAPVVGRHYVSSEYFKALGIRVIAGRAVSDADRQGSPGVTVISESAARRFWPGEDPIGRRVWFGTTTGPFADQAHAAEIVGVVEDVKYEAVDWPDSVGRPEFYTSYLQFSFPDTMILVKTRGEAAALIPAMRQAVSAVDPALPIYDVLTLDERVAEALARPRFNTALVGGFAGAALVLAALGVYGMLSYSVSSRAREIGVRLALGAAPSHVIALVLGEGLRLTIAGAAIGVAATFGVRRVIQGLIVGAAPSSSVPWLAAAMIVMLAVAAVAAFLPARRASATDPLTVLRSS